MSKMRSPLGRVRGLGSAHSGVEHWWVERLTAVALVPLSLWFVYSMVALAGADHATAAHWLARPRNAVLMILLLATAFHHGQLAIQVVLEDYVHNESARIPAIAAVKLLAVLLAAGAIFGVLRIAFGVIG